ncbi:unnamed protein product, partial [Timema podura]|nr:unnamed protein product [Timema podura]
MLREMVKQQKSNKLTKRITPFTEEELQAMSFLLLSGSDPRNFVGSPPAPVRQAGRPSAQIQRPRRHGGGQTWAVQRQLLSSRIQRS